MATNEPHSAIREDNVAKTPTGALGEQAVDNIRRQPATAAIRGRTGLTRAIAWGVAQWSEAQGTQAVLAPLSSAVVIWLRMPDDDGKLTAADAIAFALILESRKRVRVQIAQQWLRGLSVIVGLVAAALWFKSAFCAYPGFSRRGDRRHFADGPV